MDCQAKLGPVFSWLCSLAHVTSVVCYIVKVLDFICLFLDIINDSIVGNVKRSEYNGNPLKEYLSQCKE